MPRMNPTEIEQANASLDMVLKLVKQAKKLLKKDQITANLFIGQAETILRKTLHDTDPE